MKFKVLVLHGPNLNLLGEREPEVYGSLTLPELNQQLRASAKHLPVSLKFFQSNSEGELIDLLHRHRKTFHGVVFNPGAYTHYSYAIRDAIAAIQIPVVEVHLSDIKKREPFRRKSVVAPVCLDQVSGLGWKSYLEGLKKVVAHLGSKSKLKSLILAVGMSVWFARESNAFSVDLVVPFGMPSAAITGEGYTGAGRSPAFGYGIQFNAVASKRLSVQFGTLYVPRGFSVTTGGVRSTYSTQALMVPVIVRYKWFNLVSLGIGGYYSHSFIPGSWDVSPASVTTMNRDESGVILSGDIRLSIIPIGDFFIDVRYLYGFQNLMVSNAFTAYVRDFQVLVGIQLGK